MDQLPEASVRKCLQWARDGNVKELKEEKWGHCTAVARAKKSKDTLAHVGARFGKVNVLEFACEKWGKRILELENVDGKRPLHEAAQAGQLTCVEFLLGKDVDVDALKHGDWTPLMLACTKPNFDVVKILVESGSLLNLRNKDGWTCFHIACREGHSDIVEYLLHRTNVDWRNSVSKNGRTPLHTAAHHGCEEAVELLLREKLYDLDKGDNCGTTPFMDAVLSGHVQMANLLLKHHPQMDLTRTNNVGQQAIHLAAEAGMVRSLQFLIVDHKVDVNTATSSGITPLYLCHKEGHVEAAKLLLELGAIESDAI